MENHIGVTVEGTGLGIFHSSIDGLYSDAEVISAYGIFYNWHAVSSGKLCPAGWSVANVGDWTQLIDYIALQGYRNDPDNPGGLRHWGADGYFWGISQIAQWWSATEHSSNYGWARRIVINKHKSTC